MSPEGKAQLPSDDILLKDILWIELNFVTLQQYQELILIRDLFVMFALVLDIGDHICEA